MHSLVHREGRPLDELLPTVRVVANMRPDTAVDPLMSSKVAASRECFTACAARIGFRGLCWGIGGSVNNAMLRERWGHARKTHGLLYHLGWSHMGLRLLSLVHLCLTHLGLGLCLGHLSLAHLGLGLAHVRLAHVRVGYWDHGHIHGCGRRIGCVDVSRVSRCLGPMRRGCSVKRIAVSKLLHLLRGMLVASPLSHL